MSSDPSAAGRKPFPIAGGFIVAGILLLLLVAALFGSFRLWASPQKERRRVLELPLTTTITRRSLRDPSTPKERPEEFELVTRARIHSRARYSMVDIGDVRIALAGPPNPFGLLDTTIESTLIVDAGDAENDTRKIGGASKADALNFYDAYAAGITTCTLNGVSWTIQRGVLRVAGTSVPLGQGPRVVFLRPDGGVAEVVELPRAK